MAGKARSATKRGEALAYLRTSAATNLGGDSDQRQREAIRPFARSHGYERSRASSTMRP